MVIWFINKELWIIIYIIVNISKRDYCEFLEGYSIGDFEGRWFNIGVYGRRRGGRFFF